MNRALAFSLVAAALVGGCAQSWNRVETEHVTLYTSTDVLYKETLRQLENAHASLSSSFFRGKDVGKVEVLFLDDPEFIGYFGNFRNGAALAAVPGDGEIGKKGLLVLRPHAATLQAVSQETTLGEVPSAGPGAALNRAGLAAKEMMTHLFVERAMPQAPLWFHEGFAAYVRTSEIRSDGQRTFACFGYPQPPESLLPVSSLWDVDFNDYAAPERRGWFQSTGYLLIDYIMHADGGAHRQMMMPIVEGVSSGQPSAEVVQAAFGGAAPEAIDEILGLHKQAFDQMMSTQNQVRGNCPYGVIVANERRPDERAPRISPVEPAKMEALFRALDALPARDEYPPYYPPAVIAKVKVPKA